MAVVAFNASSIPQVSPWEGFTFKWFGALLVDQQMWGGLLNSLIVGVTVVAISVPVGLGGAMLLAMARADQRRALSPCPVYPGGQPRIVEKSILYESYGFLTKT